MTPIPISLAITGDTATAVTVTSITRSDTGAAPAGVSLPLALAAGNNGGWSGSFSDSNPAPFYFYSYTITWSDGTMDGPLAGQADAPGGAVANNLQVAAPSGQTLYAVTVTPAGLWFNTATLEPEAFSAANWASYVVPLVEAVANSGMYFGSTPAGLTQGLWLLSVYVQSGTSPASSDSQYPTTARPLVLVLDWSGSAVNSLAPLGSPTGPVVPLPAKQTSAAVAQQIVDALYVARLQLATQTVVSVNVDGVETTFTDAGKIDQQILFWERKAALLSGRRRRVQSIRMNRF